MIKLAEIIQDNENLRLMKKYGQAAKKVAAELLSKKGLELADHFILRIKEFRKNKEWVAMYRANTIIYGRPIFWINVFLPEIVKEEGITIPLLRIMVDNILHEWFHAICDGLRVYKMHGGKLKTPLDGIDEEDLAEKFISYCGGDAWRVISDKEYKFFDLAIKEFNNMWEHD